MDPSSYLGPIESKTRYLLHNNDKADNRYINFLSELAIPCFKFLDGKSNCLDYGCGPTKAMEYIFNEKGLSMDSYDPVFYPEIRKKKYDLITCNEAIEHFYEPTNDFAKIYELLNRGSVLGLGSSFLRPDTELSSWYYIKDPTHVSFYSFKTLAYIAQKFNFEILDTPNDRVVILRKL